MPLTQVFVSFLTRAARHTRHDLAELLTVAVCSVLSGVDDFVDIELWAKAKIDRLRGFMKLEHGVPSHDTIGRVFGLIAPDEFESAFRRWVGMVDHRDSRVDTKLSIEGCVVMIDAMGNQTKIAPTSREPRQPSRPLSRNPCPAEGGRRSGPPDRPRLITVDRD